MCRRGRSTYIRNDAGSNFMGVRNEDDIVNAGDMLHAVSQDAQFSDIIWQGKPPLASHFGGVWEREIGCVRRAFEALLLTLPQENRLLTREQFTTLMAELKEL